MTLGMKSLSPRDKHLLLIFTGIGESMSLRRQTRTLRPSLASYVTCLVLTNPFFFQTLISKNLLMSYVMYIIQYITIY